MAFAAVFALAAQTAYPLVARVEAVILGRVVEQPWAVLELARLAAAIGLAEKALGAARARLAVGVCSVAGTAEG